MNKVIGNIHLSPGRSFQTGRNVYELVPYLRDDGSRHDFSHTIHHFAFEGKQVDESPYDLISEHCLSQVMMNMTIGKLRLERR